MKSGNYDMVPTEKNRNSKHKYGLTQYEIDDYIAFQKLMIYTKVQFQIEITPEKNYLYLKKK